MRLRLLAGVVMMVGVPVVAAEAANETLVDAVKNGDKAAVRTLVKTPGAVNAPSVDGTTALHWAVQAGDLETINLLIRSGAKVSTANRYGVTPLALAALNGNAVVVERLLDAGANANTRSPEGETVLMTAARTGNTEIVKRLLARGADVNAREAWLGQTALMWAAADNHAAVVGMLLEARADASITSNIFADHEMKPADGGTPKAPTSKGGMTALHYAARQGAVDAVRVLVDQGVDVNQVDPDGMNALLYATINGHTDTAALLLEKGANPNIADTFGRTVLYAAIDLKDLETVTPRPAPKTNDKTTALDLARLAVAKGAALNAQITGMLPPRSTQGNNDTTPPGATPMWRAAKSSDTDAVRLLLDAGADATLPSKDGITPLMVAAGQDWKVDRSIGSEQESIATVKTLLAVGMDVNAQNVRGETALHGAADRHAPAVVKFLVENGARLEVKDRANRTALDVAMGEAPFGGRNPFEYKELGPHEATAAVLRELMAAKGVAVEPYMKPEEPKKAAAQ